MYNRTKKKLKYKIKVWKDRWNCTISTYNFELLGHTVKLANSVSPFKLRQVKFSQKVGLENDNNVFFTKKNWIHLTLFMKNTLLSFSPTCCLIRTFWCSNHNQDTSFKSRNFCITKPPAVKRAQKVYISWMKTWIIIV